MDRVSANLSTVVPESRKMCSPSRTSSAARSPIICFWRWWWAAEARKE